MKQIDYLKFHLDDFFKESSNETISRITKKEEVYFNKSLFELEKHLFDLKREYNVNQNLNCGILSNNIMQSFDKQSTFLKSRDYSLSFLLFLAKLDNHGAEDLLGIMDKYVESIKEKLTYHDITTTDTRVTRCYTNLRFALKELRDFGLVFTTTSINDKFCRSLLPTPFGYLISLFVWDKEPNDIIRNLPDHRYAHKSTYSELHSLLGYIKTKPTEFLNHLFKRYEQIVDFKIVIQKLNDEYLDNVLKYIEITNDGFKVDLVKLDHSIELYYLNIADQEEISLKLQEIVLALTKNR